MPTRIACAVAVAALASAGVRAGDCLPDLDGSGDVSVVDLVNLLGQWGPCPIKMPCTGDINVDDVVDELDLIVMLDCWGPCPCNPPGTTELFDRTVTIDVTGEGTTPDVVTHVYATGDDVAIGDALLAVALASFETVNTAFHQHPLGDLTPPPTPLCDVVPETCQDTFFTMNLLTDDARKVVVTPGASIDELNIGGSWFVLPDEPEREAVDISAVTGNAGQAGVLIAQISWSFLVADACEYGYTGNVTLFTASEDGGTLAGVEATVEFIQPGNPECPWDCVGSDGIVGIDEFLNILGNWGQPGACDYDGSGAIGIEEFLKVLGVWGSCCP